MNNIPDNLKFYRYSIESMDILFPNEPDPYKVETKFVSDLAIERDYDNDYFPIIKISMALTPKIYAKVVKNKLDVKLRLRVQKYIFNSNNEFTIKKDVFNDIFCFFLDENTPFLAEKLYDKTKEDEKITPRDLAEVYTFFLFRESDLNASKKIVNKIISKSNMTDLVGYLLSDAGFNKVLMTPLENRTVYNQILLPPLPILGELLYLEQQYGFYKTGALIFFDIDCMYFINCTPTATAYKKGEYTQTVFTVKELTNPDTFTAGCLVDDKEKKYYMNLSPDSITLKNDSVISDQVDGNNLIIINPKTGNVKTENPLTIQRGTGTFKVLVNKYENDFCNEMVKIRRSENSNYVTIIISNFDLEALTPNKEFLIIFENTQINKQHGGNYRLSRVDTVFKKEGEDFTIHARCIFKKFLYK